MRARNRGPVACVGLLLVGLLLLPAWIEARGRWNEPSVRFATFNVSLERGDQSLIAALSGPGDPQARAVAEIIQRSRPDVLLLNEFDFDPGGVALRLFRENYLEISQNGAAPIQYAYVFAAPSNTGIDSGFDLDNDGQLGGPNDAFGFGLHEGHFGMALLSRYPIVRTEARTFQRFRWIDMPGARLPDDADTPEPADFYSPQELAVLRLSSKSHWDVPVLIGGRVVHVLASHPTPPVFDGPEDRNGLRNADEIRFFADYIDPWRSSYIVDDQGRRGGLRGSRFVILGDQNADPFDGDSTDDAILQLLEHPRIDTGATPRSAGGTAAALRQGSNNLTHLGPSEFDTADFAEEELGGPGNLRADYALPSRNLRIEDAAVFWPTEGDPLFRLVGDFPFPSSDHRLVYVDLRLHGPKRRLLPPIVDLEFLGEEILPTGFEFQGTEVGGLSGIDYLRGERRFVAISDDRGGLQDPRFYELRIDLSDGRLDPGDVEFSKVIRLLDGDDAPFSPGEVDPEAIRFDARRNVLFWTSEGDAAAGIAPFVRAMTRTGRFLAELETPGPYAPAEDGTIGIRNNLAFESLAAGGGFRDQRFVTATENALVQDGPAAGIGEGSPGRLLELDARTGRAGRQWVYPVAPIPFGPEPSDGFATNGLVELLGLERHAFLAVERAFAVGVGNTIRLFLVDTRRATDVRRLDALTAAVRQVRPVSKRLLLDLALLGRPLDNIEGVAFGPELADGSRTLILVSDNNFGADQFTQFLAFRVVE